jgi:hypothetical protein
MQTVMESLCRCFGTTPLSTDIHTDVDSIQDPPRPASSGSTPDMKRRTRSLALKDKQWDALFSPEPFRSGKRDSKEDLSGLDIEHAHAVAKAKLSGVASFRPKRKRSPSCSRDEIFRTKKPDASNKGRPSPFSRFLSNNPVLANSLCFATPVKGSTDEPDDSHSVFSNSDTVGDDTMTSTLYYETTKLAGLTQKTPPMPLFNTYAVDERDDIHQIVASHSHTSAKMRNLYREQQVEVVDMDHNQQHGQDQASSNNRRWEHDDSIPPPMAQSSSSNSSRQSER